MSDNNVYLAIVDDVWQEIEEKKPKSRDEVMDICEEIQNRIVDEIDTAVRDITDEYCEAKDLYWEEDD